VLLSDGEPGDASSCHYSPELSKYSPIYVLEGSFHIEYVLSEPFAFLGDPISPVQQAALVRGDSFDTPLSARKT
jgi:hypothetical protein